jgi:hypothetical protein
LQLDTPGSAPGFRRDHPAERHAEARMPLVSTRSLWDWATKIAVEQCEPFALVLSELAMAAHRGELVSTTPHSPDEEWSRVLPLIAEAARMAGAPWPRGEGPWVPAKTVMVETAEMERWLAARMPSAGDTDHYRPTIDASGPESERPRTLWTWNQALAWCIYRDLAKVANPPRRLSVTARSPKPGPDGNYPPVYGTVAQFGRAVADGLLTKVGELFVADQVTAGYAPFAAVGGTRRRCEIYSVGRDSCCARLDRTVLPATTLRAAR